MAGPLISFLTAFGAESTPAVCRGVMWSIAADARILDLTHSVRKFAVRDGAFLLSRIVAWHATFGEVQPGEPLLYEDADYGGLGIAVNQDSAAARYGLAIDPPVRIEVLAA